MRSTLFALSLAAALTSCSVAPVSFTPENGQAAEDCAAAGDEDGNGLADCGDPACAAAASCQPVCGNGIVEAGEACDDGNDQNGDGCERTCTRLARGNGIVDPGEQGDDGNATIADGCDTGCVVKRARVPQGVQHKRK